MENFILLCSEYTQQLSSFSELNESRLTLFYKTSVKGRISKRVFQKAKHAKISEKFRKFWCALLSWNTRFEIRPFAYYRWKYISKSLLKCVAKIRF